MKPRFQYLDKSGDEVVIGDREALREYVLEGRVDQETLLHDGLIGMWAPASMHAAFTRVANPLVERAARVGLEMPVELRFDDSARVFSGRTVNISETGILVLSDEARPRGTLVHFEFGPGVSGLAEIIWRRAAEAGGTFLGIRFQSLQRGARQILRGLLQMAP